MISLSKLTLLWADKNKGGPNQAFSHTPKSTHLLKTSTSSQQNSKFFQPITPIEVFQCIHQLHSYKAIRADNIPVSYIKTASEVISAPLSDIYNRCVIEGVFPDELKLAKVIPVHRGGSTKQPNHYRPISILSPFSKIFETLILQRLDKYVSEFEVVNKNQIGFRKNYSTSLLAGCSLSDQQSHRR